MRYTVELTERAEIEVERLGLGLLRRAPEAIGGWQARLTAALASFAFMPNRCPFARENNDFPGITVRQLLYGKERGVYRALFYVIEPDDEHEEGVVRILRVLHGSQILAADEDE